MKAFTFFSVFAIIAITSGALVENTTCVDNSIRWNEVAHSCDLLYTSSAWDFDHNRVLLCSQSDIADCCATCARLRREGVIGL